MGRVTVRAASVGQHVHPEPGGAPHVHRGEVSAAGEATRPTGPSRAVLIDVGTHRGALVLTASAECEGREVEIHPVAEPAKRTHVWVLARVGPETTLYAAVFPSLPAGDYAVLAPDGSTSLVVAVPPNKVTSARWAW